MSAAYLGAEHVNAQLLASLVFADTGSGPCHIELYSDLPTDPRGTPDSAKLMDIVLAKPCGTVAGESFTLLPASTTGTMILVTGFARWARWVRSDGKLVVAGTVSNMDSDGAFRIDGGTTPDGETTPLLQAGGLVVFGSLVLG